MTTGCIVQARMGSTRFPGKCLAPLGDTTTLGYLLKRLKFSEYINYIVVATTWNEEDDIIEQYLDRNYPSVGQYRGSPQDVLSRYFLASRIFAFDPIVRVTADCPLIDPRLVDSLVNLYIRADCDYCSLIDFPDGLDCEVFSFSALEQALMGAVLSSDREHVTPYIWRNKDKFKIEQLVPIDRTISQYRWTIDHPVDLQVVSAMVRDLHDNNPFGSEDMLEWAKSNPTIIALNSDIQRNEGYAKSLSDDELYH